MARSDKGTKRELTQLADRIAALAKTVASTSVSYTEVVLELKDIEYTLRGYDQRDRLKEDKT
jgi:hypothetical protein